MIPRNCRQKTIVMVHKEGHEVGEQYSPCSSYMQCKINVNFRLLWFIDWCNSNHNVKHKGYKEKRNTRWMQNIHHGEQYSVCSSNIYAYPNEQLTAAAAHEMRFDMRYRCMI